MLPFVSIMATSSTWVHQLQDPQLWEAIRPGCLIIDMGRRQKTWAGSTISPILKEWHIRLYLDTFSRRNSVPRFILFYTI